MNIDRKTMNKILKSQENEITENHIYNKLANIIKDTNNKKVLEKIAEDELRHYYIWKEYTNVDVKPSKFKIWKYYIISKLFGLTFGIKLMEKGEKNAQESYNNLNLEAEKVNQIIHDEEEHESKLLSVLDEDFLKYTSSMVLGLNDALVELTGALAGFTLALRNSRLIALVGLVTGIAASMSMASSEYLSTKADVSEKSPVKASIFTGIAYIITVIILILPFLFLENYYVCLGITLFSAVAIIYIFNYYISVAKDLCFKRHFFEMASLSLGIAVLSFFIGYMLRMFLGVDI